jgi:hypothetical protein
MKKIKQSFVEVVAGQPRKEHYINFVIGISVISIIAGIFLTTVFSILNVK